MSELVKRLRQVFPEVPYHRDDLHREAADRIEALEAEVQKWRGLENAAANHVEAEICMRSRHFTGEPPYVGWEGLGLALREDYARMTALEAENARLREGWVRYEVLRRMHVQAFKEAQELCRRTGKPFDDIVIELAPFYNVKTQP